MALNGARGLVSITADLFSPAPGFRHHGAILRSYRRLDRRVRQNQD